MLPLSFWSSTQKVPLQSPHGSNFPCYSYVMPRRALGGNPTNAKMTSNLVFLISQPEQQDFATTHGPALQRVQW